MSPNQKPCCCTVFLRKGHSWNASQSFVKALLPTATWPSSTRAGRRTRTKSALYGPVQNRPLSKLHFRVWKGARIWQPLLPLTLPPSWTQSTHTHPVASSFRPPPLPSPLCSAPSYPYSIPILLLSPLAQPSVLQLLRRTGVTEKQCNLDHNGPDGCNGH